MWSLVQEMRLSLIYPLIAFCVLRNWRAAVVGSFVISTGCIAIESKITIPWAFDPLLTLSYLFLFTAGAALAHNADSIRRLFSKLPVWCTVGLWLVALRVVTVPVECNYSIETSAAALLIITLCFATNSADRFLALRPFRWLGRVSYSLYLVHLPIVLTYVHLFYGKVPLPVLLLAAIGTALIAAEPMHRWVAVPSVNLAQRVSSAQIARFTSALRRALIARARTSSHVIAE
jgi:peptidoglycan/LPS O-acetylase OafA/YrhL